MLNNKIVLNLVEEKHVKYESDIIGPMEEKPVEVFLYELMYNG